MRSNKEELQFVTGDELNTEIADLKRQHTVTWLKIEKAADSPGDWEILWRRLSEIETKLATLEDRHKRVVRIEEAVKREVRRIRSLGL